MRRKGTWLVLVLMLVVGVMWRVEHPPLTKEESEIRAFFDQASFVEISYPSQSGAADSRKTLSKVEFAPFTNSFYLAPEGYSPGRTVCDPQKGVIYVQCQLPPNKDYPLRKTEDLQVRVSIAVAEKQGYAVIDYPGFIAKGIYLHPATVKRWTSYCESLD